VLKARLQPSHAALYSPSYDSKEQFNDFYFTFTTYQRMVCKSFRAAIYPESAMSEAARLNVQVRDWYVESFKELRNFKPIRDAESELKFTSLLRHIYHRHRCGLGPA
jgi:hypothetical protein